MESPLHWRFRLARRRATDRYANLAASLRGRLFQYLRLSSAVLAATNRAVLGLFMSAGLLLASQSIPHWGPAFRVVEHVCPQIVIRAGRWIAGSVPPDFDSAPLLTASLAVAGTFVAVYFATITFVVSSSYKDATKRVRDQVLLHRGTDWYSRLFAHGVSFTALALFLPVAGRAPTHLTLVAAGLVAALVVLSFTRIWATLFMLLEPTSLFEVVNRDLRHWFRRAERLSRRRRVSPVSAGAVDARISDGLQTLSDVVALVLDREYERAGDRGISASFDSRIALSLRHVRSVWAHYAVRKSAISTLPGWSRDREETKDWFLASESEVSVALATRTSLVPQQVPDRLWVERSLAGLITRLLDGRSLRSLDRALQGLPAMSQFLGGRGQFEEARLWRSALTFPARRSLTGYVEVVGERGIPEGHGAKIPSQLLSEEHFRTPDEASAHNLAETVIFEMIEAALGYVLHLQRVTAWLPTAGAVFERKRTVDVGAALAQATADSREVIHHEIALEGHRVTPDSDLVQHAARIAAATVIDELEELVSFCEVELKPWVINLAGSNSLAAGAALSRMLELTAKVDLGRRTANSTLEILNAAHLEPDDRWPNTKLDGMADRTRGIRDSLELPIAELAATVAPLPDPSKPDHFGWAYHHAYDHLLERVLSMQLGDVAEFRQKVALLYWAGDLATRRLQATVRRQGQGVINAYVSEPNVRFLQLSGIAVLLANVAGRDEVFEPFERVWLQRMSTPEQATETLTRAAATLVSVSTLFAITTGAVQRTSREMAANAVLESLGVPRRLYDLGGYDDPFAGPKPKPEFTEETLRLLRATRSGHFEGMFYATWLRAAATARGAVAPVELEKHLSRLGSYLEDDVDE